MLMPDTGEIVGGGKDGKLFVLNQSKLGGLQQHHWPHDRHNPPVQYFQAARPWRITLLSWFPFLFAAGYHHNHGSPVYWNSRLKGPTIYLWPEEDNVRAFHYDPRTKFHTKALTGMMGNKGMPGGFLSVSANGSGRRHSLGGHSIQGRCVGRNRPRHPARVRCQYPATPLEHRRQRTRRQLRFRQVQSAHRRQRQGVSPHLFRPPECIRTARSQRRRHAAARAESLERPAPSRPCQRRHRPFGTRLGFG